MVKVSVILTTYNSGCQIQQVIDSILGQDGREEIFKLELLVVDDCSTDNTQDILSANNIKFLTTSKNTGGPNHGRNIALSKCTGDYICISDHDDIWFSHKISKLLSVVDLAPIVTSGYNLLDKSSGNKVSRINVAADNSGYIIYSRNDTFISKLTKSNIGQQTYLGSIMFSSSFKSILFEEEYGMIDFDWILRLFNGQESVEVCEALYLRNVDGLNLSLNEQYRINDYYYSLESIEKYRFIFEKEVRIGERRINGSMGRYYYLIGNMPMARKYFLRSEFDWKILLYLITTFVGSKLVKRWFNVFG